MIFTFFNKKASTTRANKFGGGEIKNGNMSNKELVELRTPIIRKLDKRKEHSSFIDNTWGADLVDVQLIRKFNKGIRFLLCVIDIFSKYVWVISLKDKEFFKESNRKPNKIWIHKEGEFYNRSIK